MTWMNFDTRGVKTEGANFDTRGISQNGKAGSDTRGINQNGKAGSDTRGINQNGKAGSDTRSISQNGDESTGGESYTTGITLPLSQLIPLVSPQSTPFFFSGHTPSGLNSHCGVRSAFSFPRTRFLFPCGGVV